MGYCYPHWELLSKRFLFLYREVKVFCVAARVILSAVELSGLPENERRSRSGISGGVGCAVLPLFELPLSCGRLTTPRTPDVPRSPTRLSQWAVVGAIAA